MLRLHALARRRRLFLRGLLLPTVLALQHGLADIGTDLLFQGINRLGKLAIGTYRAWSNMIFLTKTGIRRLSLIISDNLAILIDPCGIGRVLFLQVIPLERVISSDLKNKLLLILLTLWISIVV